MGDPFIATADIKKSTLTSLQYIEFLGFRDFFTLEMKPISDNYRIVLELYITVT